MTRCFAIAAVSSTLMAGCTKDLSSGGGAADSGGGSSTVDCDTIVVDTQPVNGATDHYYRDPVVFQLSEPDPTATVMADFAGSVSVSDDGLTITFSPDQPLEASSDYSVALDYCYGRPEISFETSAYGAPLEASTDIEGAVYTLKFTDGDYTVGASAGELLNAVFSRPILIQLQETDGPYLDIVAAVGKVGVSPTEQDTCGRTLLVNHVSTDNLRSSGHISGGVEDQIFGANRGLLRFDSFDFEGTVSADGMSLGGIRYGAEMGVAEMVALLPEFGDEDAVCLLADNLDIPCEPCGTDPDLLCIQIAAEHISGARLATSVVEIEEVGVHEDCESDED